MEGIHSGLASFKTINLNWLDREDLAFDVTKVFPEMFSLTEDIAEARSPTHKCREKILHTTKIIRPAVIGTIELLIIQRREERSTRGINQRVQEINLALFYHAFWLLRLHGARNA